jgi:type VI secretion system ImpB/VipA family protein
MKDFHPDQIVTKVAPLKELLEARDKLKQLKLQVLKDVKFRKAIEAVLNEGGNSVDSLMTKLAPEAVSENKEAKKK